MDTERLQRKLHNAQDEGDLSVQASTSKKLADIYYEHGKYEQALELYKVEEKANKRLGNPTSLALSQRMLCECSNYLGEFKNAKIYGNEYLRISQENKNLVEEQRAWVTIGRVHYALAISIGPQSDDMDKKTSYESALVEAYASYKRGLKIIPKLQHTSHKELSEMNCRLMLNMALVVELQGDVSKAVQYLTDAVKVCKNKNLLDDLYRCYYALGDLYKNQHILDKSLEYFNLALLAAQPLDQNTMCEALIAKAKVLISQGHYQQGKDVIRAARKIHLTNPSLQEDIKKVGKVARCLFRTELAVAETPDRDYRSKKELFEKLGDVSAKLSNYSKAVEYYHHMLKYAELAGDADRNLVPAYVSLAQTYKDLKRYDKAIEYYKKELEVYFDDPQEACLSTMNIAEALYLNGACYAEIEEEYLKARSLADETGKPKMVGKVLNQVLKLQVAKKMTREAAETVRELDLLQIPEEDSEDSDMEESPELVLSDSETSESEEEFDRPKPTRQRQTFKVKKNDKGETALHSACIQNKFTAVLALIKQGHPINEEDNCGWTPLHEACNKGFSKVVELLLDNGARIDVATDLCGGVTPLHDAASNYHPQVIELLLERGADTTKVDTKGKTALHYLLDVYQKGKDDSSQAELNTFYSIEDQIRKKMIKAGVLVENLPPKSIQMKHKKYVKEKSAMFSQASLLSTSYMSQSTHSSQLTHSSQSSVPPTKTRRVCSDQVVQRRSLPAHGPRVCEDRPALAAVERRVLVEEPDSDNESRDGWKPMSPSESVGDSRSNSSRETSPRRRNVPVLISSSPEDNTRSLVGVKDNVDDPVEAYSKVMTSLRYSNVREMSVEKALPPIEKSTKTKGFLAEDEVAEDEWLEEDCRTEKYPKKRKINWPKEKQAHMANNRRPPGPSRPHWGLPGAGRDPAPPPPRPFERHALARRPSHDPPPPSSDVRKEPASGGHEDDDREWQFDSDWNDVDDAFLSELTDVDTRRHASGDTADRQPRPSLSLTGLTSRNQLERTNNILSENSSARENWGTTTPSYKPLESPVTAPLPTPVPEPRPSMGIKVRVQDSLLFIPVKSQDQTFGSLSVEVSDRYCRQFGVRPTLSLRTKDGALLIDSDPVSLVYGCDEIVASATSWEIASLAERYDESCRRLGAVVDPRVKGRLTIRAGALSIANLALSPRSLGAALLAVHEQDRLACLDLSGNLLGDDGMKQIADCLPTLQQLKNLNLSDNAVTSQGLKHLSDVIQPPDVYPAMQVADNRRHLQNLTDLDLSHNFLSGDESWVHLSNILDGLSLKTLRIQSCHMQSYTAAFPPLLSLETLTDLDIGFNPLGCDGVSSFLGRLSSDRLAGINMAATRTPASSGRVTTVLRLFLERNNAASLRSLDLSHDDVRDGDLVQVLTLLEDVPRFESLRLRNNPALTGVALAAMLRRGVGRSPADVDLSGCPDVCGDVEASDAPVRLRALTLSSKRVEDVQRVEELWAKAFKDKAVIGKGPFGIVNLTTRN